MIALPPDHQQQWAECTYAVRSCDQVLNEVIDPKPGSALDRADAIYHWEKISVWARTYLRSASEHLGLWADLVAPYDYRPGDTNLVRVRPYLLLARAGLEAAAHAIWLLDVPTNTFEEAAQRHIRLIHRDFEYHRSAIKAHGEDTSRIDQRIADLETRAASLSISATPKNKPPGYESIVRNAAQVIGEDDNRWAYLWNAASGAGHGQNWFGLEAYDLLATHEYEPGHLRSVSIPDPTFLTETAAAASSALQWGTLRWLTNGGHDPSLLTTAMHEIFARMPKKADRGISE